MLLWWRWLISGRWRLPPQRLLLLWRRRMRMPLQQRWGAPGRLRAAQCRHDTKLAVSVVHSAAQWLPRTTCGGANVGGAAASVGYTRCTGVGAAANGGGATLAPLGTGAPGAPGGGPGAARSGCDSAWCVCGTSAGAGGTAP